MEETGLIVRATKLIAVYSSPHRIFVYSNTDQWQGIDLFFLVELVGGSLCTSDETTDAAFFTGSHAANLDMLEHDRERIADAFAGMVQTIIR